MTHVTPASAIGFIWVAWMISWFIAAVWSRRTAARPSFARQLPDRIITLAGAYILFRSLSGAANYFPQLWHSSSAFGWAMVVCVIAGMAFAWWARVHLGAFWSGSVTRKAEHRIIESGPYAIVRHPIYTGILFSLLATALERGRIEPIIGFGLMALGFWMKARLEEAFLAPELPEYAAYRARVPMLVPFLSA